VTLRPGIYALVPDGARFEAELTDDGILLRFVGFDPLPSTPPENLPAWMRTTANGNGAV
jgi:hypothetical protein